MPTTPTYGWPYQARTDPPGGDSLGANLALGVEATVAGIDTRLAAQEAHPLPVVASLAAMLALSVAAGYAVWRSDINMMCTWDGSAWRYSSRPVTATVAATQSTASASYVDLATAGPAVTLETGNTALVTLTAGVFASGSTVCYVGVAVSGATTVAAVDSVSLQNGSTAGIRVSMTALLTGLTQGVNTFTAKYHSNGSVNANYFDRAIVVEPK